MLCGGQTVEWPFMLLASPNSYLCIIPLPLNVLQPHRNEFCWNQSEFQRIFPQLNFRWEPNQLDYILVRPWAEVWSKLYLESWPKKPLGNKCIALNSFACANLLHRNWKLIHYPSLIVWFLEDNLWLLVAEHLFCKFLQSLT